MSLEPVFVVGLNAADHFLKYHSLIISCYLAHTCISALNAHTFYQSTRRYLLPQALGISPLFWWKRSNRKMDRI